MCFVFLCLFSNYSSFQFGKLLSPTAISGNSTIESSNIPFSFPEIPEDCILGVIDRFDV